MYETDHPATEAEAHAEWHIVTGRLYGCPWDACHPPEPCHVYGYNSEVDYGCTPEKCNAPIELVKYYVGTPADQRTTLAAKLAGYPDDPPF